MSKEIAAFKKHFEANCPRIKVITTVECNTYPHWKRLIFASLNCEEMMEVARYIKKTFSNEGMYSHLRPRLGVDDNYLSLTVDIAQIQEKIMK